MEWLLKKLLPFKIIRISENPDAEYLIRFFLWGSKGDGDNRRSIRIHKIKMSDGLRDLHDHPWNWTSIIFWGGYFEHDEWRNIKRFWPGMINRKKSTQLHALELVGNKPAWTLFFCGPRTRVWGFMTDSGWVPHYEYEDKLEPERFGY